MLVISEEQQSQVSTKVDEYFKADLRKHLRYYFAIQTSNVNDSELDNYIDYAVKQAKTEGLTINSAIESFIDFMVLLGADFQNNPLYSSIITPLHDADLSDQVYKLDKLYDSAWPYLDNVRGEDGLFLFSALGKISKWNEDLVNSENSQFVPAEALGFIKDTYPQKFEHHSAEQLNTFVLDAYERANNDQFLLPDSQYLYISLAFVGGLGFFHDPLISSSLGDEFEQLLKCSDQDQRQTEFLRLSSQYANMLINTASKLTTQSKD